MNERLETAISSLNQQLFELDTMIETFTNEHKQLRSDVSILNRMLKQCTKMQTPNGLKQSIEDHRTLLQETITVYKTQIKDCKSERSRIHRALSILNT